MKAHGSAWKRMEAHGSPWKRMEAHGCPNTHAIRLPLVRLGDNTHACFSSNHAACETNTMNMIPLNQMCAMDSNLSEFYEVAEFHSAGVLIEVAYYDTLLDGAEIQCFTVTTKEVKTPEDICHVYEHVAARNIVPLNASGTAHSVIVTMQQDQHATEIMRFDTAQDALSYATDKISKIARDRCN
jgi:hypothetical protein